MKGEWPLQIHFDNDWLPHTTVSALAGIEHYLRWSAPVNSNVAGKP
jgi:hypothetical protein